MEGSPRASIARTRGADDKGKSPMTTVTMTVVVGGVVILLFVLVSMFSQEQARRAPRLAAMVKTAAQWSTTAAHMPHPLIRFMHVVYAVATLNEARKLGTSEELEKACGFEIEPFALVLAAQQAEAIRELSTRFPDLKIQPGLASAIAGWSEN